ncbi:MAG TPA: universal stress protein [Solirubrobacteraceae bacterium]|jgi:nucleotide-binding universal stress UspA family protein
MKNIVLGYDDSEPSQRALERAAQLAKALSAELAVVSVAPLGPGGVRGAGGVDSIDSPAKHAAELSRAREYLEGQAVTAVYQEIVGDPAEAIVAFADQRKADLIIVGTRDHSMLGRMLGQSISETVSHHAHCDMLVVH